ncbi:MAG TPA: phosphatase PAP2 family protein [Bacteroidales bacterium]|nr:phosphatase PAP2 family protein [Bacteroidales bacterium]
MPEHLDQQLFIFINSAHSPFWDQVMHAISGKLIWVPLYLAILVTMGIKYKRKFLVILLLIAIAATFSDQASVMIKNMVQRLRPCHDPALEGLVHLFNGECGGLYGFVSSHATNSFDVALLSLLFIKRRWFSVFIVVWALVVGYSRIYLGVHYPGDVICGSVLGSLIGWGVYRLYVLADKKVLSIRPWFEGRQAGG